MSPWRVAVLALGVAAVTAACVLWLVPSSRRTTTVAQSSTTAVNPSAGHGSTTTVRNTTTTAAPAAARSDTMLVALLTLGAGLLAVAGVWDGLQEFAIGGVSVKLVDAAVSPPGIALLAAAAGEVAQPSSTSFQTVARGVHATAELGLGLVRVDLKDGMFWAPLNLKLYVLLLTHRSKAEVIVFRTVPRTRPDIWDRLRSRSSRSRSELTILCSRRRNAPPRRTGS